MPCERISWKEGLFWSNENSRRHVVTTGENREQRQKEGDIQWFFPPLALQSSVIASYWPNILGGQRTREPKQCHPFAKQSVSKAEKGQKWIWNYCLLTRTHSRVNEVWLQQIPIALISEPVPSEASFPLGPLLPKGLYLSILLFSAFEVSSKFIVYLPNFRVSLNNQSVWAIKKSTSSSPQESILILKHSSETLKAC